MLSKAKHKNVHEKRLPPCAWDAWKAASWLVWNELHLNNAMRERRE
jgi:hypothetical protein